MNIFNHLQQHQIQINNNFLKFDFRIQNFKNFNGCQKRTNTNARLKQLHKSTGHDTKSSLPKKGAFLTFYINSLFRSIISVCFPVLKNHLSINYIVSILSFDISLIASLNNLEWGSKRREKAITSLKGINKFIIQNKEVKIPRF